MGWPLKIWTLACRQRSVVAVTHLSTTMKKPQVAGIFFWEVWARLQVQTLRAWLRACTDPMQASGLVVSDQGFPEHGTAQVPVPDGSAALDVSELGAHQPLEPMLQVLSKLAALGATAVASVCNNGFLHSCWAVPKSRRRSGQCLGWMP